MPLRRQFFHTRISRAKFSITGGEPLTHPDFAAINVLLRRHVPRERLNIFTFGPPKKRKELSTEGSLAAPGSFGDVKLPEDRWPQNDCDIIQTYGSIGFNPHNDTQKGICRHHPLTVAIGESVADEGLMWKLINNCWTQRLWAPTVNIHGAYFCEIAGALDRLLYDGAHAWAVEPGWWKRPPYLIQDQDSELCGHCGMSLPQERQLLGDSCELFSPGLLKRFRERGLQSLDESVRTVSLKYTRQEVIDTATNWYPANYREDLTGEQSPPPHTKGLLVSLDVLADAEAVFAVDTPDLFAVALERAKSLPLMEEPFLLPHPRYIIYEDFGFDPLREPYPFVLQSNPVGNMLFLRGMLLYFRALLSEKSFLALSQDVDDIESLAKLVQRFNQCFEVRKIASLRRRLAAFSGSRVRLWGGGAAYAHYKHLLGDVNAECILSDLAERPVEIDGIPLFHPQNMPEPGKTLPLIIFARVNYIDTIADALEHTYPELTDGGVVWVVLR